jgi:O-succinylbenzoate synthase
MTTLVPIEHTARSRRGIVVRRGRSLGEASPLVGRSRESYDEALHALALGSAPPPSADLALFALDATYGATPIRSQVLLEDASRAPEAMRAALLRGAHAFKLKLHARDEAEVLATLRALAPTAILRVDANRSFARESDVPWDALARAGVEWIEEPCADAGSLVGTPVPIALDESVESDAAAALEAVADGRAAALVLKPTLLGATRTLAIGRDCQRLGGRAVVSHAFESVVGLRACTEIARRLAPNETHGLARWDGIDAYRVTATRAPIRMLLEDAHGDSAMV